MGWRYGPIAKTIVFLIAMFNMCIALLAEYTTIGSIFSDFVGSVSYGIIIVVGVLTLAYTAYGGLAVSIATDMMQGIASVILAVVLGIFVAVTYRCAVGQRRGCQRRSSMQGIRHLDGMRQGCGRADKV
jgi:Na+/proline symporter